MKNFFKKLSFVLAIAMVLTTLAPATASAAAKNYAKVNGKKAASTTAFFGGVERKIVPYFNGKTSSKVTVSYSKEGIAKVENNGVVKPLKNGTTVVTFKSGKNTVKVTVKVRTRAKALNIYDRAEYKAGKKDKLTAVELKVGEKKDLQVTMPIYAKAKEAKAVKSSYYTYASSSDDAVVKVNKLGNGQRHFEVEALAAGTAKVTIVANQRTLKNVKADDYWVGASFDVTVKDEKIEAKQTGKNTITVEGTDLTDKTADYVVKRGNTTVALASATLSEDKKSVKLVTASKNPVAGDYTVTFNENSAEFKMEAEVITEIKINDELAILETGTSVAAITFDVLNQFEEKVAVNAADLAVTTSTDTDALANTHQFEAPTASASGKVYFCKTSGFNTALDKVVVTIVYKKTGVNTSATLDLGAARKPDTVEVLGFYEKNAAGDFVETTLKESTLEAGKYFLVAEFKDQYGKLIDKNLVNDTTVSMNVTAPLAGVEILKTVDYATKSKVPFGIAYPVSPKAIGAGDVSVIAVVLTSGKTSSKTFTVTAETTIVSLELTPSDTLYVGKATEVNYVALDADGKEVTDYATLNAQVKFDNTNASNATLAFKKQADGSAKLYVTPKVKNFVAVANSSKNKFYKTFVWSASDACVAKAITGISKDASLGALTDETIKIPFKYLNVEDQYGNAVAPADVVAAISDGAIKVVVSATAETGVTVATGDVAVANKDAAKDLVIEARSTAKTAQKVTLKLQAKKADGSGYEDIAGSDCEVTLNWYVLSDVSNFAVKDLGLKLVGTDDVELEVTGMVGTTKVAIPEGCYEVTVGDKGSAKGIKIPADDPTHDAKVREFTTDYQITLYNKAGETVAFKVNVSKNTAVPTTAKLKSTAKIANNTNYNLDDLLALLEVKDQYGEDATSGDLAVTLVTVSNYTKTATIVKNGTSSIEYKDADTTAHFKFVFKGGYTFETDINVY